MKPPEPDEFRDVVRPHLPWLYGLACRLVGAGAEDLLQECLVKAYRSVATLRDRQAAPAWLRQIMLNLVRDMARVFPRAEIPDDWSFWMGHRPCFPDSLPVMGPSRHRGLWFNFGHGHLGLTGGPITGRHVAALVAGRTPEIDLSPFRIDRF